MQSAFLTSGRCAICLRVVYILSHHGQKTTPLSLPTINARCHLTHLFAPMQRGIQIELSPSEQAKAEAKKKKAAGPSTGDLVPCFKYVKIPCDGSPLEVKAELGMKAPHVKSASLTSSFSAAPFPTPRPGSNPPATEPPVVP